MVKLYLDSIRFKIERWGLAWVNQIIWGWLLRLLHGTCYGTCFYLYYHGCGSEWSLNCTCCFHAKCYCIFFSWNSCFILSLMQRKWNCTSHLSLAKRSQNVTMWVSNCKMTDFFFFSFYCLASRESEKVWKRSNFGRMSTNLCIRRSEEERRGTPHGEKKEKQKGKKYEKKLEYSMCRT